MMKQTPKEKAQELYSYWRVSDYGHSFCIMAAKWCVDEIIKANPVEIAGQNDAPILLDNMGYWQQVKQELQKM